MSLTDPKQILIIKLRHHGDVLLTTPVVAAIKQRFPDCEVDMLVYQETADIIRDNPDILNIFSVDRSWKKQGVKAQIKHEADLFKLLKARRYDWAFNLSDQWRTAVIAKFCAQCSVALDYKKRDNAAWRFFHDFINPDLDAGHHVVERHLAVLPPLLARGDCGDAKVLLTVSGEARRGWEAKLREQGWRGEGYVLVHPGSRWLFKCWEDGKNAAVVQLLLDHGCNVVLTAAPDEAERNMLDEILGRLNVPSGVNVWDMGGRLNLRELAAAIDGAQLFFGVDSVPMHIAAALDKPQVALFGPTWVSRWRPYSEQADVVWAGDFGELPHPESINTDNKTRLLGEIPLEAVWEKIASKLGCPANSLS
ncbi:putative lipopolysaccharide heptosyltransferase III [Neisseria iguanae]|uniref:Putative lipopolysaccharide heptosyltransferase III n=1 Tax=Neisseria iguanae TaxID=90242 RepID=A0A2P7TY31_9NEIS|nr:putative lipopolysaccharide heptosyltransferase III [Neisseria iguanae]PSJ79553.1 putative lipopolysaccharide heptosyltransferase III [Neisseria iguanae]